MFSVIIPLYNKAAYVEKAIRSVAAQTFREFEVIVVDDGSTDIVAPQPSRNKIGTGSKGGAGLSYSDIEQLIDGKGRLIKQKNSGVSVARNNGVALAKNPYICFLDADDWWAPTYLEEMKALIDEFPGAGIYGSSYYIVKNGKERPAAIGVEPGFEKGTINYCQVYARTLIMPLWTGAVVVPKAIFDEQKGFKPTLKLGEDFDLWIRVALRHPVVLLNKPLAYYNQDVELKNRAIGKLQNPVSHILWNIDYLEKVESSNPELKQLLDNLRTYSLFPYYISHEYRQDAAKLLKKVNWTKQPAHITRKYKYPVFLLGIYSQLMSLGSKYKQILIRKKIIKSE